MDVIDLGEAAQSDRLHMSKSAKFRALFSQVPEGLLLKVHGHASEDAFHYIGSEIAKGLRGALPSDIELEKLTRILDFGSGLGRVSNQLLKAAPEAQITGFDIDPAMIHWSRHLLPDPRIQFVSSSFPLPSGGFDLITVVSVFTHLDDTTDFWLSEIHRLLRVGGVAFITYQDETLFGEMQTAGQLPAESVCTDKYVTGKGGPEGGAAMGTFYTSSHWQSLLARHFDVLTLRARGLFGHQSISVVRRNEGAVFDRARLLEQYAASLEKDLFRLRRDHGIGY